MKEQKLHFNLDMPKFLEELTTSNSKDIAAFKIPFRVLQGKLIKIGERAAELNDPELNILMLEMKIYDVEHNNIQKLINKEKLRIK